MPENQTNKFLNKLEKLKEVMLYFNIKTDKELAIAIGISQAYMSEILNAKKLVPKTMGQKIEDTLGVSRRWFDLDEGEMIAEKKVPVEHHKVIGSFKYPDDESENPFLEIGPGQYLMLVPKVDEYAYAGYLSGFKDPTYIEDLPKHSIIVNRKHRGRYMAIEVLGESMSNGTEESITDGSVVTGREIQRHLWRSKFHTHRYKDYIINHKDGILIKRIKKHDTERGIITLESLNLNKEDYPDKEVSLDDVNEIFNIVNVSKTR